MKSKVSVSILVLVMVQFMVGLVQAAEFHVTTAQEFQAALTTAASNGEDDNLFLAAGTYIGGFEHIAEEDQSIAVRAETGLTPNQVILDGANIYCVLYVSGHYSNYTIEGLTIQNGANNGLYLIGGDGVVSNCIIAGNWSRFRGGGLHAHGGFTFTNNIITGNSTGDAGGGVYASGTPIIFTNNSITGNSAYNGGGVYTGGGTTTFTNNTITGNSASRDGGGVYTFGNPTRTFTNNTITGNSARNGGGLYVTNYMTSTTYAYNNIIWGNEADDLGDDINIYGADLTYGYNNDYHDMIGLWDFAGNNIDADPLFVNSLNGDYHLSLGSPAIDTGDNSAPELPQNDRDGKPRIMGGTVDMGAYEYLKEIPPMPGILLLLIGE